MKEHVGMTCLYKNGESKDFTPEQIEAGKKEGWKDTPQPVVQSVPSCTTTFEDKPVKDKLDPKRP